ncbi:MAG: hypothetical protein LBR85_02335 [Oscillospiraceae bacterium]|nr:hypothetical protein [Oscillospiraceae bacterium]
MADYNGENPEKTDNDSEEGLITELYIPPEFIDEPERIIGRPKPPFPYSRALGTFKIMAGIAWTVAVVAMISRIGGNQDYGFIITFFGPEGASKQFGTDRAFIYAAVAALVVGAIGAALGVFLCVHSKSVAVKERSEEDIRAFRESRRKDGRMLLALAVLMPILSAVLFLLW